MKRILCCLFVIFILSGMTACGNKETATAEPTATDAPTATEKPTATTEPTATDVPVVTTAPTATKAPEKQPTLSTTPTPDVTKAPTKAPTATPTKAPTKAPTKVPTATPTKAPTKVPTKATTATPTKKPTATPTKAPTKVPTATPTKKPTATVTPKPTTQPTTAPVLKRREDVEKLLFKKVNAYRVSQGVPAAESPYSFNKKMSDGSLLGDWMYGKTIPIAERNAKEFRADHSTNQIGAVSSALDVNASAEDVAETMFQLWKNSPMHNMNMLDDVRESSFDYTIWIFVVYEYDYDYVWSNPLLGTDRVATYAAVGMLGGACESERVK